MKVATFNVNSIRSRAEVLVPWLAEHRPQVLCVQETKVQDDEFPLDAFADTGYHIVFAGQKKYNGVAIFSDQPIEKAETFLPEDQAKEARFLKITHNNVQIINTYIPQGQSRDSEKFQYKLKWFSDLLVYFNKTCRPNQPIIWMGDLNVALDDRDVHDPKKLWGDVCFCQEVQDALNALVRWGFVDVFRRFHPEPEQYSFWDYRVPNGFKRNIGWRLDYIMATAPLAQRCTDCRIDKTLRGMDKPSDHTPVIAEFGV
jgi:exodeoxyribonuclease-3